jgi:hypothetical protein
LNLPFDLAQGGEPAEPFRISIFGPPWCDITGLFTEIGFLAPKSLFDPDIGLNGLGQGFRILGFHAVQGAGVAQD